MGLSYLGIVDEMMILSIIHICLIEGIGDFRDGIIISVFGGRDRDIIIFCLYSIKEIKLSLVEGSKR
jgi:hypothetical protein